MIQFRGINVVLWFILARFRSLLSFQINQKSINALKTKVVRVQYKVLSETKRPVFCFVLFLLFPLFVSINQEIKPSHGLVYQPPHPIPTPPSFRNQLFLLDDQYLQTQKCNKQSSWNKNTLPNGSIQVTNHDSRAPQSRALHFATSGCPLGLSLVPPWSFLVSRFWKNYILLVSTEFYCKFVRLFHALLQMPAIFLSPSPGWRTAHIWSYIYVQLERPKFSKFVFDKRKLCYFVKKNRQTKFNGKL